MRLHMYMGIGNFYCGHLFALLVICFVQIPAFLHGLPIGNPSEPAFSYRYEAEIENNCLQDALWCGCFNIGSFSPRLGYYGDFVYNRHLKVEEGRKIEKAKLFTNAGYLAIAFCDQIELFGTIGVTKLETELATVAINPAIRTRRVSFESSANFSWSLGARLVLWELEGFTLGAESQYFDAKLPIFRFATQNPTEGSFYPSDVKFRYREWQIGGGLSYTYCSYFTPYIGVKWSMAKVATHHFLIPQLGSLTNWENDMNFGYAIGLSFTDFSPMSVTVEARFADEKAFYLNAQLSF